MGKAYNSLDIRFEEDCMILIADKQTIKLKLKIPEQTEPLFRGKLNQMLKDGFANQI